jgi:hypothetical protein
VGETGSVTIVAGREVVTGSPGATGIVAFSGPGYPTHPAEKRKIRAKIARIGILRYGIMGCTDQVFS